MRIVSALGLLAVISMMIVRASDESTWKWLAPNQSPPAVTLVASEPAIDAPAIDREPIPDAEEREAASEEFQAVSDQEKLSEIEMPAYWRLARWGSEQSFNDMWRDARHDVLFTDLWEQPEKYRGQLIALKLHVKRVLHHEAPANSAGVRDVYEAWGWTDESKSFPYLVVFTEAPPDMPLGADVYGNATFVGYFLKTMAYEAFDARRAAPLLIGRLHWQAQPTLQRANERDAETFWYIVIAGGVVLAALIASWFIAARRRNLRKRALLTPQLNSEAFSAWLGQDDASDDSAPVDAALDHHAERDAPDSQRFF
jgi:hypothetical protein